MKKLLSVVLATAILLQILPLSIVPVSAISYTSGDYMYTVVDGEATILDYTGEGSDIVIPTVLGGCPVTTIGSYSFSLCQKIVSVVIPEGVTTIQYQSFSNCINLYTITIPNTVQLIGAHAFQGCKSLSSISIPDSVTEIGQSAFEGCISLVSVTIPGSVAGIADSTFEQCTSLSSVRILEGVGYISYDAFKQCTNLTTILLPKSVTNIGQSAFSYCGNLSSVTLPSGIAHISAYAFSNCNKLTTIKVEESNNYFCSIDGVLFNKSKTTLEQFPGGKKGDYTVPNGVTAIGYAAFYACSYLTSVTIPDSLVTISVAAFENCENLTSINGGKKIVNIDSSAFEGCSKLSSVTIPDTVTNLGSNVFYNCDSLTKITIPGSVKRIDGFGSCDNLATVTIKTGAVRIGKSAFSHCSSLVSVTIEEGVAYIEDNAFWGCTSLVYIAIPKSILEINHMAFDDCSSLQNVYFSGTEEQWNAISFENYNEPIKNAIIHYGSVGPEAGISFKCGNKTYKSSSGNGYCYKDAYFDNPATTFNQQLATMSLCLALSTYQNSNNKYENTKKILSQCDFTYKPVSWYGYDNEPTADSIACVIGSKEINDNVVIAVAVRSGGYSAEWASNVTVGSTGDHKGFDAAANTIVGNIKDYISENGISGSVKFWITGYSRGAATATHTAAKLNKLKIPNVNFDKTSIYAYGFATPAGASALNKPNSENYNNIFNILHYHDIVPLVAPLYWGFTTYGVRKVLPAAELSPSYTSLENYMKDVIDRMTDNDGSYDLDKFHPVLMKKQGVGTFSRKFINSLALNIGDREKYVNSYQSELRSLLEGIMKDSGAEVAEGVLDEAFSKDLLKLLSREVATNPDVVITAISNLSLLAEAHAHSGAYYLAWMQSMDSNYFEYAEPTYYSGDSRTIFVNCPVDVYVYDKNSNLVAAIENEEPEEIAGSSIVAYVDENNQKVIHLPVGQDYDVQVVAREQCNTTYTINEYSSNATNPSGIITYKEIPMAKGQTLYSNMPTYSEEELETGTNGLSDTEYTVKTEGEALVIPDERLSGDEILEHTHTVSVCCNEKEGVVSGSGVFTTGEFCLITAQNNPGYEFQGWLVDGETISTEYEYRFAVEKDVFIEASYRKCSHIYDDDKDTCCNICNYSRVVIVTQTKTASYAKMGAKVSTKVTAEGDGLKYTWYIKNEGSSKYSKSSVTSATYSATMSAKAKNRRVYCVVEDAYGNEVKSKTFILRESVSITSESATARYAKLGAKVSAKVSASGDGLKYTWYVKNAGATKYTKSKITSATYSVKMSSKVNGRRLICYVTDKYGNKVQCETVKLSKK